ncbi:MAG: hypothetical protein PSV22_00420 [Pseudolabrys sp.]|nr:hypothetical protein [Pseudolabrys sp.]
MSPKDMTAKLKSATPDVSSVVSPEADGAPRDIDAFRQDLARRLHILVSNQLRCWCSCREPSCKRARACRAPQGHCSNRKPGKPVSERQSARSRAMLARALREHGERLDAERERHTGQ